MRIDVRAWLKLPWPTLLIGGVTVAVGAASVFVALGGTRAEALLATPAKESAPLNIDVSAAPRASDLAAIQTQPLLHASRVFYVAPAPNTVPAAPPRPDYRLAGTFLVPGKPAVALLVSRQGNVSKRVKPGDELEGWRVQVIDRRLVTLVWNSERFDISTTPTAVSAGLKRVPMQRQRVAASGGGVQSLGATGSMPTSISGAISDQPRLYRPPPN